MASSATAEPTIAQALQNAEAALSSIERTVIRGDVVEYSASIAVGPSKYDRIGIHRVVRERSPGRPRHTSSSIFLIHGSASSFDSAFLPGKNSPVAFGAGTGLATTLAEGGIDVWGIDLRWTNIPANETDFSFMQNYGLAMYLGDVARAVKIARVVRLLTGSGIERMHVGGHSIGGTLAWALANEEAVKPQWQRDVKGIVPIDIHYKLTEADSQYLRDNAGVRAAAFKSFVDAGVYQSAIGATLVPFVGLALVNPTGPSPLFPGLNNLQAVTAVFTNTYLIYAPLPAYTPWYHFNSGTFDSNGIPTGFRLRDVNTFLSDFATGLLPYQSNREAYDLDAILSGTIATPFDDNLAAISVPVLYVGAAGGFGRRGTEIFSLIASTDTSSVVMSDYPEGQEVFDVGHIDLLYAPRAEAEAWQPMLSWLLAH